MNAESILSAARRHLDTPFAHQGRIAGRGLDCAGLAMCVATDLGLPTIDVTGYGRRPHQGLLKATLDSQPCLVNVAINDMQPGDVLLIRFEKEPQHVAIYAGETIIHTWLSAGKVCEHRLDDTWRRRIVSAYRFIEVIS